MPTYQVKTEYGVFRVTINDDIYTNSQTRDRQKIGTLLSVGGKNTCVFINIPANSTIAHLTNLKTKDGGCELAGKHISGIHTVGMVNLAFTIVRKIAPHIKQIWLEDDSDFTCEYKNGMKVGISMILYEFAFYQQSYYEKRFGAYLQNETMRNLYEERKHGFEEKPPEFFPFNNKDLQELLTPLYINSQSWKAFFQSLKNIPNVCEILFPWYRSAMNSIFKDVSFERQKWLIDLYNNTKVMDISYTVKQLNGGGRKTQRNIYKHDIYNSREYIDKFDRDTVYMIDFKKYRKYFI